jgi:hypothetical protein
MLHNLHTFPILSLLSNSDCSLIACCTKATRQHIVSDIVINHLLVQLKELLDLAKWQWTGTCWAFSKVDCLSDFSSSLSSSVKTCSTLSKMPVCHNSELIAVIDGDQGKIDLLASENSFVLYNRCLSQVSHILPKIVLFWAEFWTKTDPIVISISSSGKFSFMDL